jgi:hypothetical protein
MSTLQFTDGRNLAPYEQECLVIESRNKTPDRDVDRRVSWSPWSLPFIVDSGLVPPGCNDELSVVVWKLRSDKYRVLEDKHVLKDVPGREKDKNYYLEEIETFLTNCQKPGGEHRRTDGRTHHALYFPSSDHLVFRSFVRF